MSEDPREDPESIPFLDLIHDVGPYALRLATYWIAQPTLAEDIVQEAVAKAWTHHDRLTQMDNPRAWFLAIVRRECIDYWRRQKRQPTTADLDDAQSVPIGAPDPFDNIDSRIDISALLGHLSPRDQELLAWRYGMDWSLDTIAEYTGIPLPTVKSRIYRALKVLRRRLNHATPSKD